MDLLDGQRQALDHLLPAVRDKVFAPFLLFGVTGSGKTLVYCHAAREAVESGGSVLVMVPEIALSGLLLSSFAAFFGDHVAVMHSGLTNSERLAVRERIASGEVRVVIGPRSAIFSPLKNLRLIVVDEEHDPSYKQDDPAPRYHGRDAAVMLARMAACPIILGSASPSIESYQNAVTGRYHLLTLDQRPKSGYRMPSIEMLDMKREKISGDCSFMSYRLKKETEIHLAEGGQVIYYLNRRGFSPRLKCADCGEVPSCPDCGVTLTYHKSGRSLKCHFCDRIEPAPDCCPSCGSGEFLYLGAGTQRVEEVLARLFESARSVRIDSDRTATKSGRLILGDFADEKYNLLVGTQMVTKGLDIPGVTLVGVLSADIGLDMPDFRAAEKTYARLLQVAGRAGRGDREGVVMIQTYYTDHPVIRYLQKEGYRPFFDAVIEERRQLFYPPFSRLINITLSAVDEKLLEKESLRFRVKLEQRLAGVAGNSRTADRGHHNEGKSDQVAPASHLQVAGPAPAPMYKLRGSYRRRIFIKTTGIRKIVARLRRWEADEKNFSLPAKVRVIIDVDPVDMM
jgi:primosomal protein N' (replication factor Y)